MLMEPKPTPMEPTCHPCDDTVDLPTTVIGSFPKPKNLSLPDDFKSNHEKRNKGMMGSTINEMNKFLSEQTPEMQASLEANIMRATEEVIKQQCDCGVHIVTDGEVRRENYIHYLCRFIEGISFETLTTKSVRNNAYTAQLPTITGPVSWRGGMSCGEEWEKAQAKAPAGTHVKYTLPGPMTIIGSVADEYYKNDARLASDLASIINMQVRELAAAGCKYIQMDECVFARKPEDALKFGVACLEKCFDGCPQGVEKTMHMCCGYPGHVDQVDYPKADPSAYFKIAPALDESCLDAVSIEDAWCRNDLSLLSLFKKTKVILGTMNVSSSRVETVEEMRGRLEEALKYIEPERLMVAPDCGLGLLQGEKYGPLLMQKLTNMCAAAQAVPLSKKRKEAPAGQVTCNDPPMADICTAARAAPQSKRRKEVL